MFVEQNLSSKEVAWQMHLSPKTVDTHRANIFRKLKGILSGPQFRYTNLLDLALFAISNDMADLEKIQAKYSLAIPGPS